MNEISEKPCWRHSPGWMKLLLIVSLSVTVAVVGLVGGNAIRHWNGESYNSETINEPGLDRRQSRVLRMVPDAQKDQARMILLARQDEYAAARETMMAAQKAFIEAIRHDPLDTEKLATALTERRMASSQVWNIGYEQLAEIAGLLNATERAEMANQLEERTKRWMDRQERKGQ